MPVWEKSVPDMHGKDKVDGAPAGLAEEASGSGSGVTAIKRHGEAELGDKGVFKLL